MTITETLLASAIVWLCMGMYFVSLHTNRTIEELTRRLNESSKGTTKHD